MIANVCELFQWKRRKPCKFAGWHGNSSARPGVSALDTRRRPNPHKAASFRTQMLLQNRLTKCFFFERLIFTGTEKWWPTFVVTRLNYISGPSPNPLYISAHISFKDHRFKRCFIPNATAIWSDFVRIKICSDCWTIYRSWKLKGWKKMLSICCRAIKIVEIRRNVLTISDLTEKNESHERYEWMVAWLKCLSRSIPFISKLQLKIVNRHPEGKNRCDDWRCSS